MTSAAARADSLYDWVVNISDDPDPVPVNGTVTYTITVANSDVPTDIAPATTLTLDIPAGAEFTAASSPGSFISGCTAGPVTGPGTVTCAIAQLPGGKSYVLNAAVKATAVGVLDLTASVPVASDVQTGNNTATELTTVSTGTDLGLTLASLPAGTAVNGSLLTYRFTVTNFGPAGSGQPAKDITVNIPKPAGLSGITAPGCTLAPAPLDAYTCNIPGPIPVNGTATIDFSGQIAAAAPSTVTVTGSITDANPPDPNAANNNAILNTSVTSGSDVKIVKSRTPSTGIILVGQQVTFSLAATFTGDSPSDLVITDTLPANYQIDEVIAPANWSCAQSGPDGRTVTCTRPTVPPSSGFEQSLGTVTIKATAATEGDPASTRNTAAITTSSTDPVPGNNTDDDGGAAIRVPKLDLSSAKTCPSDPPLVVEGKTYAFKVSASNTGNLPYSGTVRLVDKLPAGLKLTSVSNANGWVCSPVPSPDGPADIACERTYPVGSELLPGQSTPTVTLNAVVLAGAPSSITNQVSVDLPGSLVPDAQPANDTSSCSIGSFEPNKSADIEVIKTASLAQVKAGDEQTFTIKVRNNGPSKVSTFNLVDNLTGLMNSNEGPAGAGLVSFSVTPNSASGLSCSTAANDSTSRTLSCAFAASNPVDENTFFPVCEDPNDPNSPACPVVQVTVRPGGNDGPRTNTARALSNIGDPDIGNNAGNADFTVTPAADLQVFKTDTPDPAKAGQDLVYVVTAKVTQDGLSAAKNVIVTDTLPEGVTFVSASPSQGPACTKTPTPGTTTSATPTVNNVVICNVGTVNNGSQQTVTIVVRPNLSLRGASISNTADVKSDAEQPTGPDTTPDTVTVQTQVQEPRLDLQITKVDDPDPVTLLDETTYTITVKNNGPSDSENVDVIDTLPGDGFAFVAVSDPAGFTCSGITPNTVGGTLTCSRPRLGAGTSAAIKVKMKAVKKGVFENAVKIDSDEIRDQPSPGTWETPVQNNAVKQRTTVIGRVDLEVVSKVPSLNPVGLLEPFDYTIVVRNNSGENLTEADDVSLNDTLPSGMVLAGTPKWSVTSGSTSEGDGPNNCSGNAGDTSFDCGLGTVSNPAVITVTVPVKAVTVSSSPVQTFVNTAEVKTTSRDIVTANNKKDSEQTTVNSATLSGFVYRDFNNDGSKISTDTGIANVPVTLTGTAVQGNAAIGPLTVNTDSTGKYIFTGLPAGTYKLARGGGTNLDSIEKHLVDGKATPGTNTSSPGTGVDPAEINSIGIVVLNEGINFNLGLVPTARIGIAKFAGTAVINADGSVNIPFTLNVKNHSLEPVQNVKVSDVLSGALQAFGTHTSGTPTAGQYTIAAAPSGSCPGLNSAFNGDSDIVLSNSGATAIAAGGTCNVKFTVRVRPASPLPPVSNGGRYLNQAEIEGVGALSGQDKTYKPGGATVSQLQDLSDNGTNTDSNNNGISNETGENDKTPVNFNFTPKIDVTKTATVSASPPVIGTTVSYKIKVKNSGNVNLTQASAITDTLKNGSNVTLTLTSGPTFDATSDTNADSILSPNETWIFDASYTLTQADIDSGSLNNTAGAEFTPPYGTNVTGSGNVVTALTPAPAIALVKTADAANVTNPAVIDQEITYSFTVTNIGNVTLTNITLTDPKVNIPAGLAIAKLEPGQSDTTTFTASYKITQADLDTGEVRNTATVSGKPPTGNNVTDTSGTAQNNNDATIVPLGTTTAISLTKDGAWVDVNTSTKADLGDKITYTYKVTNTGSVTLTSVGVNELAAPAFSGTGTPPVPAFVSADQTSPAGTLKPGETATYTADYTLTQADIDAGKVDNQAETTGKTQTNKDVSDKSRPTGATDDGPTAVELPPAPSIALVKTANATNVTNPAAVDQEITYSFTVTNTGNVTLTNITLTDPKVNIPTGLAIAKLDPGQSDTTTFSASYKITQADLDARTVKNTATVTGKPPTGDNVTDTSGTAIDNNEETVVELGTKAGIAVTKSGIYSDKPNFGITGKPEAGDIITYTYEVKNTGNVTLTAVGLKELSAQFTGKGILPVPVFVNEPGGPSPGTLLPGETATYTAEYTLTQDDIDAGKVDNQASAEGTPPSPDNKVTDTSHPTEFESDGPTTVDLTQKPGITLLKTVKSDTVSEPAKVGETITYAFTVTNTGNVTLTEVAVSDLKTGTVTGGPIKLDPGQTDSTTFTATYTLTQADIDAAEVQNTGSVTGKPPSGPNVTDDSHPTDTEQDGPTIFPLVTEPKISIIKEGVFNDANGDGGATEGETITYTYKVANAGNVTLKSVEVLELADAFTGTGSLPAPAWQSASLNSGEGELKPTETATYTATYTVSEADIDAGKVDNRAVAEGTPDIGSKVTDKSHPTDATRDGLTTVILTPPGKIAAVKTSQIVKDTAPTGLSAGDTLRYTITVKNIGGATLTDVRISSDDLSRLTTPPELILDFDEADFSPSSAASLAPGASVAFTGNYSVVQADIDAGGLSNTAVATGLSGTREITDTSGTSIDNDDPTVDPVNRTPAMTLKKTGKVNADKVTYTFLATNTGNVTLFNVGISEQQAKFSGTGALPVPEYLSGGATIDGSGENNDLAPGASVTWTASYTMTKADITAGHVDNVALAEAEEFDGKPISAEGGTRVSVKLIDLVKDELKDILTDHLQGLVTVESGRFNNFARQGAQRLRSPEDCKDEDPDHVNGGFLIENGPDGITMSADADIHKPLNKCAERTRYILDSQIDVRHWEGETNATASITLLRETLMDDDTLFGQFFGGYLDIPAGDSDGENDFDGTITGIGLHAGIYGAERLKDDLVLDGYLAASLGRQTFDLTVGGDLDILAEGESRFAAGYAGVGLSGEFNMGGYAFEPRASLDAAYALPWMQDLDLSLADYQQSATMDLAEIGLVRSTFETRVSPEHDEAGGYNWAATPKGFCQYDFGYDPDLSCGVGLRFELGYLNEAEDREIRLALEGEVAEDFYLGTGSLRYIWYFDEKRGSSEFTLGVTADGGAEAAYTLDWKL